MTNWKDLKKTRIQSREMAAFTNASDAFYDDRTSPRTYRNQALNRQAGGSDPYGGMNGPVFGGEAPVPNMRYDGMRDGFGAPLQNAGAGNVHFPYDASAAQTWSAGGASLGPFGNGMGSMQQNANYGPSRSIKPSRGRVGVQQVSILRNIICVALLTQPSSGTISLIQCNSSTLRS